MVWITISHVCEDARQAVLAALEGMAREGQEGNEDRGRILLAGSDDTKELAMQLLERALAGTGYVVAENTEDEGEVAILKEGNIEQLGLYLCSFCATVFRNEAELDIHRRAHFFGFG